MGAPDLVVVHPLVLLSVVDHYNRVARDTKKRVVGVLLGETYKGRVDITNSFAGLQVWRIDGSNNTMRVSLIVSPTSIKNHSAI